jgi:hypothetical protein
MRTTETGIDHSRLSQDFQEPPMRMKPFLAGLAVGAAAVAIFPALAQVAVMVQNTGYYLPPGVTVGVSCGDGFNARPRANTPVNVSNTTGQTTSGQLVYVVVVSCPS